MVQVLINANIFSLSSYFIDNALLLERAHNNGVTFWHAMSWDAF